MEDFCGKNLRFVNAFVVYSELLKSTYPNAYDPNREWLHVIPSKDSWITKWINHFAVPFEYMEDAPFEHPYAPSAFPIESGILDEAYFTLIFQEINHPDMDAFFEEMFFDDERRITYSRMVYYIRAFTTFFTNPTDSDTSSFRYKLYHVSILLSLKDSESDDHERSIYSMCSILRSLDLFREMKYEEAYKCAHVSNIDEYVSRIFIPIMAMIRAYIYIKHDGDLIQIPGSLIHDFSTTNIVEDVEGTVKIPTYKREEEIPNILRRRDTNVLKSGHTPLIFHPELYAKDGALRMKIKGKMITYSVKELCEKLPTLLRMEQNKRNFMYSSNLFFDRSVKDMNYYYKNQLFQTIISFCDEIASTKVEDIDLRMKIVQNYYGKMREGESMEQYIYNFRYDVFNAIGSNYCYYASLSA